MVPCKSCPIQYLIQTLKDTTCTVPLDGCRGFFWSSIQDQGSLVSDQFLFHNILPELLVLQVPVDTDRKLFINILPVTLHLDVAVLSSHPLIWPELVVLYRHSHNYAKIPNAHKNK